MTARPAPDEIRDWSRSVGVCDDDPPLVLGGRQGLAAYRDMVGADRLASADPETFGAAIHQRRLSVVTATRALRTPLTWHAEVSEPPPDGDFLLIAMPDAAGSSGDHVVVVTGGSPEPPSSGDLADVAALRIPADELGVGARTLATAGVLIPDTLLAAVAARSVRGFVSSVIARDVRTPTLAAEIAMIDMLSAVVAETGCRTGDVSGTTAYVREQTHELIERHFRDPSLSPAVLAGRLHLSRRQFYRHFEDCDRSVAEMIADRRLQAARVLLISNPAASIASVARACGFASLGAFRFRFRRAYGLGPNEFRDRLAQSRAGGAPASAETSRPVG
ncbi:helix-turn-helix domain-containing protein [Gordonia cholesterolivorans]|uniref:HTH araC/xylS-type domain-containing protein n=1 Tax=Gordonia cholesterolivorans TaxID=559625 RepID=A0ABN3HQR6_9ACTN